MLQIVLKIANIASSVNTAAYFVSRVELKVTEKVRLELQEDVQATPIDVTTSSLDVADEVNASSHKKMAKTRPRNKPFKWKEQSQRKATECNQK